MELNDFESLCAALRCGTNCEEPGFSTALNESGKLELGAWNMMGL